MPVNLIIKIYFINVWKKMEHSEFGVRGRRGKTLEVFLSFLFFNKINNWKI